MKVLFYSPNFLPKIGGLENMVAMLAKEFHLNGIDIRLITYTRDQDAASVLPYEVHRNPSPLDFLNLVKWCDVFFHHNVSLKGLWPLFIFKRKFVIAHHTSHYNFNGSITFIGKLKQIVTKFALNICCSSYIASLLPGKTIVIPNCYDTNTFKNFHKSRTHELIFVGRLVSDKGCSLIIEAINELKIEGLHPQFTIVGLGPEEVYLKELVHKYHLQNQVVFAGSKTGVELVNTINKHYIMVVPSIWEEPFGIVALEGLACGCKMIVANTGGLPEAIGDFGLLFEKNNPNDLTIKIKQVLNTCENQSELKEEFLKLHSPTLVAKKYIQAIKVYVG